jgi:hypothetical protein
MVESSEPESSHSSLFSLPISLSLSHPPTHAKRTLFVCPVKRSASMVGKGCRSLGFGSCGTRLSGSMNIRFLRTRGQR